jgi:hypothetical protein
MFEAPPSDIDDASNGGVYASNGGAKAGEGASDTIEGSEGAKEGPRSTKGSSKPSSRQATPQASQQASGQTSSQSQDEAVRSLLSAGSDITASLYTKPGFIGNWALQEQTEPIKPQHDGVRWETRLKLDADLTRDVRVELWLKRPSANPVPKEGQEPEVEKFVLLAAATFDLTDLFASTDGPLWVLKLPLLRVGASKNARPASLMVTAGLLSTRQILPFEMLPTLSPGQLPSDPKLLANSTSVPDSAIAIPGPIFMIGSGPPTPLPGAMQAAGKGKKKKGKGKGKGAPPIDGSKQSLVPPVFVSAQPTGVVTDAGPCTVKEFALSCARIPALSKDAIGLIVRVELQQKTGAEAILVGHTELTNSKGKSGGCMFTMPFKVPPKSRTDQMLRFKLLEVSDENRSFDLISDTAVRPFTTEHHAALRSVPLVLHNSAPNSMNEMFSVLGAGGGMGAAGCAGARCGDRPSDGTVC